MTRQATLIALAVAGLAACNQDRGIIGPAALSADNVAASAVAGGPGAVYTLMNQTSGNAVAVFQRAADGTLTTAGAVATGGTGTGAGLGSQGAIALSEDGRWLFAVNAGSNDVSAFRVNEAGLSLVGRVGSGGTRPISLTVHGKQLYVLNAGGSGNITGFSLKDGQATSIPGSTRPLSGSAVGPAQVAFSPDGRWLVVTEKNTNLLDVYAVDADGGAGPVTYASAGATPFGFSFGKKDELFVSEAGGTASSYELRRGVLTTVSGAVATHQGAPCWLAVTKDGRFAYTANAQSGTISGFDVKDHAMMSLLDPSGVTAVVGGGAVDLAFSESSRYLYQLRSNGTITALRVEKDGGLATLGVVGAMPGSVAGLAAR